MFSYLVITFVNFLCVIVKFQTDFSLQNAFVSQFQGYALNFDSVKAHFLYSA